MCALLVLAGCGGGSRLADVKGEIKFDGKLVPDGEICFFAEGSGNPPEVLPIKDGHYSGKVSVGKKRIEIYAYKEGAMTPPPKGGYAPKDDSGPGKVNYIPARYNVNSTTTEEITADGPNVFNYGLSVM